MTGTSPCAHTTARGSPGLHCSPALRIPNPVPPSRVGPHVPVEMATRRSGTTRLTDSPPWACRPGDPPTDLRRQAATFIVVQCEPALLHGGRHDVRGGGQHRLAIEPAPGPGGGSTSPPKRLLNKCNHPAPGRTENSHSSGLCRRACSSAAWCSAQHKLARRGTHLSRRQCTSQSSWRGPPETEERRRAAPD